MRIGSSTLILMGTGLFMLYASFSTLRPMLAEQRTQEVDMPELHIHIARRPADEPDATIARFGSTSSVDVLKERRTLEVVRTANFSTGDRDLGPLAVAAPPADDGGPLLFGSTSPPGGGTRAEAPYVVLGIATSPKNDGHRSWIRRTWWGAPVSNELSCRDHCGAHVP